MELSSSTNEQSDQKWKTVILTDERLENLAENLLSCYKNDTEVISICRLNVDDVIKHIENLKSDYKLRNLKLLLIINVGLHHIVNFKEGSKCIGHTPLEILYPTTKDNDTTINKLSMNVINSLKNVHNLIKDNFNASIAFIPILPVDIIKYQEFHVNLHFYKTKHMVQNMLFSPKEGKQLNDQLLKVYNLINRWIKSDLQSFYSIEALKLSDSLACLSTSKLTDGFAISKEATEEVFSLVNSLIKELRECVGINDSSFSETCNNQDEGRLEKVQEDAEDGEIQDQGLQETEDKKEEEEQQEKRFEKVVIISDSRLKSMQPSWSTDSLIIPEIITKNGLRIRDIIEIAKTNVKLSNLSTQNILLVLSAGINDIINFNTLPECTTVHKHEPMMVAIPRQGSEAQLSKEILSRMRLLKGELIKIFGKETSIVFSHIIPMDIVQYQNEQKKMHAKATKHTISKPMLSNEEALQMTKKVFNIINIINESLDKEGLSSCYNLPIWDFFTFTSKMYDSVISGDSNTLSFLEDGLNPSRFIKNVMAKDILKLCGKYLIDAQKRFEEIKLFEDKNKKSLELKNSHSDALNENQIAKKTENVSSPRMLNSNSHERKVESYNDLLLSKPVKKYNSSTNIHNKQPNKSNQDMNNKSLNRETSVYSRLGPRINTSPVMHNDECNFKQNVDNNNDNKMATSISAFVSYFRNLHPAHLSVFINKDSKENLNDMSQKMCAPSNEAYLFNQRNVSKRNPIASDFEEGEVYSEKKRNFSAPSYDDDDDTIDTEKEWLGQVAAYQNRTDDDTFKTTVNEVRSHSTSPSNKDRRNRKSGDKFANVKSTLRTMKKEFKDKNKKYRKYPSLHPDFETEKEYFMKKKMKKLGDSLNDHELYKLEKEWMEYWPSKLDDILHKKWKKKKRHYLREHGNKSDDLDSDSQIAKDDDDIRDKKGEKRKDSSLENSCTKRHDNGNGKYASSDITSKCEQSSNHSNDIASYSKDSNGSLILSNEKSDLIVLIELLLSASSIIGNMSSSLSLLRNKVMWQVDNDQDEYKCLNESDKKLFTLILQSCKSKLDKKLIIEEKNVELAQDIVSQITKLQDVLVKQECKAPHVFNSVDSVHSENNISNMVASQRHININPQPFPLVNPNFRPLLPQTSLPPQPIHPFYQNPVGILNPLICNFSDPNIFPSLQNAALLNNCNILPQAGSFNCIEKMSVNQQVKLFSNFNFLDKPIQDQLMQFLDNVVKLNPAYAETLRNMMKNRLSI